MAFRTWGRMLLAALGVGAFAGAAQLGFAYGLGVVRFAREFDPSGEGLWAAQLAWVTWFAIVAAVAGALTAELLTRRRGVAVAELGHRLALALAAALGALVVAPLAMLPARAARVTPIDPVLTAGLAAGLGALIGLAAALAALTRTVFATNIGFVVGGIWLIALLSVAPSLSPADPLPDVRLGVVEVPSLSDVAANRLAVTALPVVALLAGVASGTLARLRGNPLVVAAGCGAVGPALVALAYVAAGPGAGDGYQAAPYWGSLIATGAGGLGSVLANVVRLPGLFVDPAQGAGSSPTTPAEAATAAPDADEAEPPYAHPAEPPYAHPAEPPYAHPAEPPYPGPAGGGPAGTGTAASHADTSAPARARDGGADGTLASAPSAGQTTGPGPTVAEPTESAPTESAPTEPAPTGSAPRAVTTAPPPPAARRSADPVSGSWNAFAAADRPRGAASGDALDRGATSDVATTQPVGVGPDPKSGDQQVRWGDWERRSDAPIPPPSPPQTSGSGSPPQTSGSGTTDGSDERGSRRSRRPAAGPPDATATVADTGRRGRGRGRAERSAPARDEEYVSWVSGLGEPDEPPAGESPERRRLRPAQRPVDQG